MSNPSVFRVSPRFDGSRYKSEGKDEQSKRVGTWTVVERGDEGERCTRRDSENRYERKGEKGRNENERRMSVHGDLSMRMGHGVEWRAAGKA